MKRYEKNPVLTPADMPFDCFAVYNGGAVKIGGEYIMMVRCEDMARRQYAWTARSRDGYGFQPDPEPVRFTADDMAEYDEYTSRSWFDPRINAVEGKYFITYAANSSHGCMVGIGETSDFKTVKHVAFPHHPQNRNGVLFPEKIDGMYALLHRPEIDGRGGIWISYSPDLKFWGNSKEILAKEVSPGSELRASVTGRDVLPQMALWNNFKIGAGAPPVKTRRGYLVITHAVCRNCAGHYYTMGAILLDLKDPSKLIGQSDGALMVPQAKYEQSGFVPNVIFPCGAIPEPDGTLKIYYGAADNYECLVETDLEQLLDRIVS